MSNFGVNIWWTIPEFVMDGEKAQAALAAHGFEKEDMPLPSRRNVVSRAAYSFQDRRHKDGRRVTEKAKDNVNYVVYGILGRNRQNDEEVSYDQSTTIRLSKDSGQVEVSGALRDDFFKALARYEDAITDDDVRNFLRNVIRMCKGVAKRPSGGIYFVPEKFVGIVESAKYAIDELHVGAKLYVEGVVNGQREREIVWDAVQTDIEGQIEATLKAVERIEKRASSVENHEAKLSEMTELMDIYRNLLGQEAKYEELAEKLEDASNQVAEKLSRLQDEASSSSSSVRAAKVVGKKSRGGIGQQVISMSLEVLRENGPLHYREIAEKVEAKGLELRGQKGGAVWLNAWICETFKGGAKSPFARLGNGVYGIAS